VRAARGIYSWALRWVLFLGVLLSCPLGRHTIRESPFTLLPTPPPPPLPHSHPCIARLHGLFKTATHLLLEQILPPSQPFTP
jgi:hypothetical protein